MPSDIIESERAEFLSLAGAGSSSGSPLCAPEQLSETAPLNAGKCCTGAAKFTLMDALSLSLGIA